MKYFYLHEVDKGENVALFRETHNFINPRVGKHINTFDVGGDICFSLEAGDEYGYHQFDPFFDGEIEELTLNQRMLDYYDHDCLFSDEFIDLLDEEVKSSLQMFPVKIVNKFNDEPIRKIYWMVNIVKLFSIEEVQDVDNQVTAENYHNLGINAAVTDCCPIFRLAPVGAVIVNSKLANAINSSQIKGVKAHPLGLSSNA